MVTTHKESHAAIHTISHPKKIQKRSRHHRVRQITANWFKVTSAESGNVYDVNLGVNGGTCNLSLGAKSA